jgi:glutamate carboxypeptidase
MVGINSWTENRAGVLRVGDLTASVFEPLGFNAERVPSFNAHYGDHLFLTRPGRSASRLLLVSHLDTVFSPEEEERNNFGWQPEGERIYGPGTHDIKGGTVLMWMLLETLRRQQPALLDTVTWVLAFNASEEVLARDVGAECRTRLGINPIAALVLEAEGRLAGGRKLVTARKGRGLFRIEVEGRAAHAGVKHAHGASAILQLAETLRSVESITDYSRDLTVNTGRITGGTGLNRVPDRASAEGEFRAFKPEVYEAARERLLALAGPGTVRSPVDGFACQVRMEVGNESAPWPRNPGSESLFECWREAGQAVGQVIEAESRGGLSDGNFLWDALPTLDGLGPSGDNDHCSERSADGTKLPEFVEPASFVPKTVLNALAVERLIGEASRRSNV